MNVDGEEIDITVYEYSYWNQQIKNQAAILLCYRYPLEKVFKFQFFSQLSKAIWMTNPTAPPLDLEVRLLRLKPNLLNDLATEMSEAKTCWKQGKLRKAK